MPYVPDPTDPTAPLDGEKASTAAAEFRALKAYLQGALTPDSIVAESVTAIIGTLKGAVSMQGSNLTTKTGYLSFIHPDGTRKSYIGFGGLTSGDPTVFVSDDGSGWTFDTGVLFSGGLTGTLSGAATSASTAGTADHITNSAYNGYGARTISGSLPSGGSDGDIWYQTT